MIHETGRHVSFYRSPKTGALIFLTLALNGCFLFPKENKKNDSPSSPQIEADALKISETAIKLAVGNSYQFKVTGGTVPYSFIISSGSGKIDGLTGLFVAPASPGITTVTVIDNAKKSASAQITVNPALAITPLAQPLAFSSSVQLVATGGNEVYQFYLLNGGGMLTSSGQYTSSNSAGSVTVQVKDGIGNNATSTLSVVAPVVISPSTPQMVIGNTLTFSSALGAAPYIYSLVSGGGSIVAATGKFTAPNAEGVSKIRVTDAIGQMADASITIRSPLVIAPSSKKVMVGNSFGFAANGGALPLTYSIVSGLGSVIPSSGYFTAGASPGSTTVRVTDAMGNFSDAIVTTLSQIVISPTSKMLRVNRSFNFTSQGGVPSLSYSVFSGTGTVHSNLGLFTAPSQKENSVVRVSDLIGNHADSNVVVSAPEKLVSGRAHSCVLINDGTVKCWGANDFGQLGLGDTQYRGDSVGEMDSNLPYINLGVGRTAIDLSAGYYHSCALLDDGTVKCWGDNKYGQLGQGHKNNLGDDPNEMGNNLLPIDLGSGKKAIKIYSGYYHNCAILDDFTTKCWGSNTRGALGLGNTNHRGDQANEMGNNLLPLDFGPGRKATTLALGKNHSCAILDNAALKCWGDNQYGKLGLGNEDHLGDESGEMGVVLPTVNLGSQKTAIQITLGQDHSCALLNDSTVKCWGRNQFGQLGRGNNDSWGDGTGEMGDSLTPIDLGTGRTAKLIKTGDMHVCAILDDNSLKCWGQNNLGQLGQGNTTNRGDGAGEMGNALAVTQLGTGRSALSLSLGERFSCAILNNRDIKCWGQNSSGELGQGSTNVLGDGPNEMGDLLLSILY